MKDPTNDNPETGDMESAVTEKGVRLSVILRVARLYQRLIILVVVGYVFFPYVLGAMKHSPMAKYMESWTELITLIMALFLFTSAYRMMKETQARMPFLWAVGLFVPGLNFIVLVLINAHAQTWCRKHGLEIGLWGPKDESIDRLMEKVE